MELTIGERLSLIRKRKGITQGEASSLSGVSQNTVGRIEAGDISPRLDQLEALADACDAECVVTLETK